ncbi:MAG: class I SAM-dependent methyltransferase [Spirochaetota bacterium]
MNRLKQVQNFIENDLKNNFLIEPQKRSEAVRERLSDVINTYNPKVIIKAGIGHGDILLDIVNKFKAYTVVVEPSFSAIKEFIQAKGKDCDMQKLNFINGDFHDFPVDYYAADLLICVDYLDFFDSGKCINEFKRALQFDGIFFFASVVLNNNDIEGVYDEFIKLIFPLHNDYYISDDINTFMGLKEFKLVKNMQLVFNNNLQSMIDYFQNIFTSNSKDNAYQFINLHKDELISFLHMNDSYDISEPYYLGVYTKPKPDTGL